MERINKNEERQKDREEFLSILENYRFDYGIDIEPPVIKLYFGRDKFSIPGTHENREILSRNKDTLRDRGVSWRIVEG